MSFARWKNNSKSLALVSWQYKQEAVKVCAAAYKAGQRDGKKQFDELLEAAQKTLRENAHLADGDNCTLKELRDAVHLLFNKTQKPLAEK
jgi:endo-1,4-beta-mannosidase